MLNNETFCLFVPLCLKKRGRTLQKYVAPPISVGYGGVFIAENCFRLIFLISFMREREYDYTLHLVIFRLIIPK